MHILSLLLALALTALQVGDWWTTRRAIATGYGAEANPVMKWLIALLGFSWAFLVKGVALAIVGWALAALYALATPALAILVLIYLWICWHNWRLVP